jgi:hypothetical protein
MRRIRRVASAALFLLIVGGITSSLSCNRDTPTPPELGPQTFVQMESPFVSDFDLPKAPTNLTCSVREGSVYLTWENSQAYDRICILRSWTIVAEIPGTSTEYTESLVPRENEYDVEGVVIDEEGLKLGGFRASCVCAQN